MCDDTAGHDCSDPFDHGNHTERSALLRQSTRQTNSDLSSTYWEHIDFWNRWKPQRLVQQAASIFHEPEYPIHPGLEFEVVTSPDYSDTVVRRCTFDNGRSQGNLLNAASTVTQNDNSIAVQNQSSRMKELKLFLSYIGLVITGLGNTVTGKFQAIPMYVIIDAKS
jgi:hypothetical protein